MSNAGGDGTQFSNFQVQTPADTDFTQYHRFGYLWVPATASSDGSAQYDSDGQATNDKITWSQYQDQPPPPGGAPWTFGILDRDHLGLDLGTSASMPMAVLSVDVWQASEAANLRQ